MEQIHGHEVMKMMLESGRAYSRTTLRDEIVAHFGPHARFYTCSTENMDAQALIDFLESKGKFVPKGDGFQTSPDLMCKH